MAGVQRLLEACTPRDEVLSLEFRDEMFMASLEDVRLGRAHPIYQEPGQFFANTYPTARLQSFLKEVAGRLSGQDRQHEDRHVGGDGVGLQVAAHGEAV